MEKVNFTDLQIGTFFKLATDDIYIKLNNQCDVIQLHSDSGKFYETMIRIKEVYPLTSSDVHQWFEHEGTFASHEDEE